MGTAKEHRDLRDVAFALSRAQIIDDYLEQISLETIESIHFERILPSHWEIVHPVWRLHQKRRGFNISLNWLQMRNKRRDKLDVSIWCGNALCGLFLAKISRNKVTVALRYLESNPYENPLAGLMIPIGLILAESFAEVYEISEVLISRPDKGLVERYREQGYELCEADSRREKRGCKIRAKVLIKKLS